MLSIEQNLNELKLYLSDMINNLKNQGKWKIQSTVAINIFPPKDSKETCSMHTKSNNIEIMIGNKTDEITEGLFETLLSKYQKGLEESMGHRQLSFDSVDLVQCKCLIIRLNRSRSHINSPKWLKNKEATQNRKNSDDKCF